MHFGNPNVLYIQPLEYVDVEQNEQIIHKIHVDTDKKKHMKTKLALFANLASGLAYISSRLFGYMLTWAP